MEKRKIIVEEKAAAAIKAVDKKVEAAIEKVEEA